MAKEKNIKSYTDKELKALREKGQDRTDWSKIDAMTDEQLEAIIANDPDERDADWDWAAAKLVLPEPKQDVHLRVDADVVRFFKKQGKGYQTRMNAVLRAYMLAHQEDATGN